MPVRALADPPHDRNPSSTPAAGRPACARGPGALPAPRTPLTRFRAQASAAVTIASPSPSRAQTLEYSQSLDERSTQYFNRTTVGPSSGPADPTMLPPVLELPPPSMEASAGSSPPPRVSMLSASAPATTGVVGRCAPPLFCSCPPPRLTSVFSMAVGEIHIGICGRRRTTLLLLR